MGVHQNSWFAMENPSIKWMTTSRYPAPCQGHGGTKLTALDPAAMTRNLRSDCGGLHQDFHGFVTWRFLEIGLPKIIQSSWMTMTTDDWGSTIASGTLTFGTFSLNASLPSFFFAVLSFATKLCSLPINAGMTSWRSQIL